MENLVAIVPAAGAGKRLGMGKNKAFVDIGGRPVLVRCLEMLNSTGLVRKAIVVLAPAEVEAGKSLLLKYAPEFFPSLSFCVVAGGRERQDSVANALRSIEDTDCYIAVHDGARPFAGKAVFERTLAAAKKYGAAIAAVPVKDTIKVVNDDGMVGATPPRSSLRIVQTPQIFAGRLLKDAYSALGRQAQVTDDASVVELFGQRVAVALGRYENIKITTPEDLIFAESFIKRQELEDER